MKGINFMDMIELGRNAQSEDIFTGDVFVF